MFTTLIPSQIAAAARTRAAGTSGWHNLARFEHNLAQFEVCGDDFALAEECMR